LTTLQGESLDFLEKVVYNNGMARPKKDPSLRMDTDVRIPLTAEQKAMLAEATADDPAGMAAWARQILLEAARRRLGKLRESNGRHVVRT
jgi:hypothetical protein